MSDQEDAEVGLVADKECHGVDGCCERSCEDHDLPVDGDGLVRGSWSVGLESAVEWAQDCERDRDDGDVEEERYCDGNERYRPEGVEEIVVRLVHQQRESS